MSFSWEPFGHARQDEPETPPPAAAPTPAPTRPPAQREPARALAILTCMDARIDPLAALGLNLGDAVVLRNAGAQVSDDVLRSLQMAHEALGVKSVHVIAHTDCAAHDGDAELASAEAVYGAERISATIPGLNARAGLLDIQTGTVR